MKKRLLFDLQYHQVFYIKNDVVSYYITIPKKAESTNISIEFKSKMDNYNLELNDEIWVLDNVKNTFSYIDNYNITLVLPVFDDNIIKILEKIDSTKYEVVDKLIANIINSSYKMLMSENIKIANQVILVNNDRYKTFINWFITKYKNRVICKNLLDLIQIFNVNATTYKKLETPVMNFVVGSYNTEVDAPKNVQEKPTVIDVAVSNKPKVQPSSGFASYWFLGVITFVVAAVVAYIAFTA